METPEQAGRRCCTGAEGLSTAEPGSGFWVQKHQLWARGEQVQVWGETRPSVSAGASAIIASFKPSLNEPFHLPGPVRKS